MLRVSFVVCVVPAVFGIIVRDPPPSPNDYKYSYNIEDPTTGDSKSQHEVRQGDVVTGAYTVLGPDGTKRTVEYIADGKNGFKAVLREDPVTQPPIPHHNYNTINTIQFQPTTGPVFVQYRTSLPEYVLKQRPYQTHAPRAEYATVLYHPEPQSNYVKEQPSIYFTPQNKEKRRLPFDGHYFIPASTSNKY